MTSNKQIVTDVTNILARRTKCKATYGCTNFAVGDIPFTNYKDPGCQKCIDIHNYKDVRYYDRHTK